MTRQRITQTVELAARHGLVLDPATVRFNDAGLDYQVAFGADSAGERWVLRIPRRDDVSAKIADEARILNLVSPRLTAKAPDWRIQHADLIAYPMLPGEPGLTLTESGEPEWHFDQESSAYARSVGSLIAELHSVSTDAARDAGIPSRTPSEVRQGWSDTLTRVGAEFAIAEDLLAAWQAWLTDDGLWPEFVTFTHGELYPAHLLLAPDGTVQSVLDWTTAQVGDPAIDFTFHHLLSSQETFQLTIDTYAERTGRVPARLRERCAALMAASPLNYGLFALTTGDPEHAATATALLNPQH